jgi:hypothetical protein
MKKLLYILSLLVFMTACGEKSDPETPSDPLCDKDWHSTSLAVEDADIYLDFSYDGSFVMYQKIGEGAYRSYAGTWNLDGNNVLSGKYSDGEDWAASYAITYDEKTLTMTSQNDAAEKSTFAACNIPDDVREKCEQVMKSDGWAEGLL